MTTKQVYESDRRKHPERYSDLREGISAPKIFVPATPAKRIRQTEKPLMNKLERRYLDVLFARGISTVWAQSFTLRLDEPFTSYRPDFAHLCGGQIVFTEVKGPHRFREKGIAKAALAAKTYPQLIFMLADWRNGEWAESRLSS